MRVETGLEPRHAGRPIEVVREILRARPDGLHRTPAALARNHRGLCDEIEFQTPAERAAEQLRLHVDLVGVEVQHLGHVMPRERRDLRGDPDRGRAVRDLYGAVERFDRAVREIRRVIFGADRARGAVQRGIDIAEAVVGVAVAIVQRMREAAIFRPEIRFEHSYNAHPYANGTKSSQFVFVSDMIFFF